MKEQIKFCLVVFVPPLAVPFFYVWVLDSYSYFQTLFHCAISFTGTPASSSLQAYAFPPRENKRYDV